MEQQQSTKPLEPTIVLNTEKPLEPVIVLNTEEIFEKEPTALEWFERFETFWIAGVVPIVIAWFAWRTAKMKTKEENRQRRIRATLNHEDEPSDLTVMQWARKEMTRRKDE